MQSSLGILFIGIFLLSACKSEEQDLVPLLTGRAYGPCDNGITIKFLDTTRFSILKSGFVVMSSTFEKVSDQEIALNANGNKVYFLIGEGNASTLK